MQADGSVSQAEALRQARGRAAPTPHCHLPLLTTTHFGAAGDARSAQGQRVAAPALLGGLHAARRLQRHLRSGARRGVSERRASGPRAPPPRRLPESTAPPSNRDRPSTPHPPPRPRPHTRLHFARRDRPPPSHTHTTATSIHATTHLVCSARHTPPSGTALRRALPTENILPLAGPEDTLLTLLVCLFESVLRFCEVVDASAVYDPPSPGRRRAARTRALRS